MASKCDVLLLSPKRKTSACYRSQYYSVPSRVGRERFDQILCVAQQSALSLTTALVF